jgi:hypothetical protein
MIERTETELAEAYESERAALANAKAEIQAMQQHRLTLLKTGAPEDVLSLDDEIRLEGIKIEIATARMVPLKNELDMVRSERAKWSGVDMPSAAELDSLLKIVAAAYPELALAKEPGRFEYARNHREEFRAAFYAIGRLGRLAEPDSGRYFSSVVDDANSILRAHLIPKDVGGDAVFAALLSWGDCVWRAADHAMGQPFESGVARLNQGSPARPVWRDLLTGKANLLAPLPPRHLDAGSSTYPAPRVRIRYGDGREVDPAAPLWVQ